MSQILDLLEKVLTEDEYKVERHRETADTPDYLETRLDDEYELQAVVLPGLESELPDVRLLQLYIPMIMDVSPDKHDAVRSALTQVNFDVPLMGFNLHEQMGFLYFRTVQVVPAAPDAGTGASLLDMVSIAHYLVTRYAGPLGEIAR
ncbi:MAG: hypothetical protein JO079_02640 [Frankiaceae bacterium]|nr:hypothetical protein [Frankiaceae bacterium]MBV9369017.1 hypothetical protein [Frankiales bacterium]